MAQNTSLKTAQRAKNDDFYTQLSDIENELKHYKSHFDGKVVYCNCDDPRVSNFYKYFSLNFQVLKLKKLITTCYKNQQLDLFSQHTCEKAIWLELEGGIVEDGAYKPKEPVVRQLERDGDFRSPECVELLKQADIVVTNPPFSLFREYVAQLIEYDKKFVIIGNKNALIYKEIFHLIKNNQIWTGYGFRNGNAFFEVNDVEHYESKSYYDKSTGLVKFRNVGWFTNLNHAKRQTDLTLYKTYTPDEFPDYDNYDAINVDKISDIPLDYSGFLGVPLTFLDNHNPDQFELHGIMNTGEVNEGIRYSESAHGRPVVNGKEKYIRVLIRNKRVQT